MIVLLLTSTQFSPNHTVCTEVNGTLAVIKDPARSAPLRETRLRIASLCELSFPKIAALQLRCAFPSASGCGQARPFWPKTFTGPQVPRIQFSDWLMRQQPLSSLLK